jgi:hypothetical protein
MILTQNEANGKTGPATELLTAPLAPRLTPARQPKQTRAPRSQQPCSVRLRDEAEVVEVDVEAVVGQRLVARAHE